MQKARFIGQTVMRPILTPSSRPGPVAPVTMFRETQLSQADATIPSATPPPSTVLGVPSLYFWAGAAGLTGLIVGGLMSKGKPRKR